MSEDTDTVTVRNDYGARIRGGPASKTIHPGDEVEMDPAVADYYVDTYGFTVVDDGEAAGEGEADADADADEFDEMDYRDLQALAGEFDGVAGNLPADELREALREKVEG